MPVFTAAIAAVAAAIAAPALATVGAAALAVGTAVGTAGLGLSVIGSVTGNKSLKKIGSTMGMVGGIVGLGGGIIGGAQAASLYGGHVKEAWSGGVGKFFSDGPAVSNAVGPKAAAAGKAATFEKAAPLKASTQIRPGMQAPVPTSDGGGIVGPRLQVPGLPPSRVPPSSLATPAPTPDKSSWWGELGTSDKIAVGLAGGRALAGGIEGMMTAGQMEEQRKLEREQMSHGGPNPASPDVTLSAVRRRRERERVAQ